MTRKEIRTVIDRFLGNTTSESVLRILREEITLRRRRKPQPNTVTTPVRDLIEILTGRSITESVLRRLRLAASKAARMR